MMRIERNVKPPENVRSTKYTDFRQTLKSMALGEWISVNVTLHEVDGVRTAAGNWFRQNGFEYRTAATTNGDSATVYILKAGVKE